MTPSAYKISKIIGFILVVVAICGFSPCLRMLVLQSIGHP